MSGVPFDIYVLYAFTELDNHKDEYISDQEFAVYFQRVEDMYDHDIIDCWYKCLDRYKDHNPNEFSEFDKIMKFQCGTFVRYMKIFSDL